MCRFPSWPNAGRQPLPEAGATYERRLEAVRCKRWFGYGASMSRQCCVVSPAGLIIQASLGRRFPDIALLHQCDLPVEHLLFIVGVVARETIHVAIFGIDRVFVNNLGHLRADVL